MNWKYQLLFLFFLLAHSSNILLAQESLSFSNIYLTEGGFLKAQVLTQDSAGWSTFQLRTGEIIRLETSSISKIKMTNKKEVVHQKGHTIATEGFYLNLQTGLLGGITSGEFGDPIISLELFSLSAGHQFNPRWQVGGGVALDFYEQPFTPLFAESKFFIRPKEKVSIYAGLQAGYAFTYSWGRFDNDEYGGGAMLHPSVGLRFASKGKTNFLLELGNRYQWGTVTKAWNDFVDEVIYRRLSLRIGWEF